MPTPQNSGIIEDSTAAASDLILVLARFGILAERRGHLSISLNVDLVRSIWVDRKQAEQRLGLACENSDMHLIAVLRTQARGKPENPLHPFEFIKPILDDRRQLIFA